MSDLPEQNQQGEQKSDRKKLIIIAAIFVAAIAVPFYSFTTWENGTHSFLSSEPKKVSKKDYPNEFRVFCKTIESTTETAFDVCVLTSDIWHDAIYEDYNEDTKVYTIKSAGMGKIVYHDFNDAIREYHLSAKFANAERRIEDGQDEMKDLAKRLKDAPKDYVDAYYEAMEAYTEALAIVKLALSPSGNYNSYVETVRDHLDAYEKSMRKLEIALP